AATRLDGLDEEPVLNLATHLETPERTRALYLVSLAVGDLEVWERDRLDQLLARVLNVLNQPDLTRPRAGAVVESRPTEARRLAPSNAVADRTRSAPRAYLLANPPEVVVRQTSLLDPAPRRGVLRVHTELIDKYSGLIEISTQDRAGLLAA